jgi:hypothetical protein
LTLLFCSGVAGMFHHGIPWISDTPMWSSQISWCENCIMTEGAYIAQMRCQKYEQMKTCWWVSDHQSVWCQRFQLLHKG